MTAGTQIGAKAFSDPAEAKEAFGFDIRKAGMLPVQVVFDNHGTHSLKIVAKQTFLEDDTGNLWPVLSEKLAYERATKYAQTKKIAKEGAYHGLLGAAAGTVIGAAVGVASGENVAESAGVGAAMGGAAGATIGGAAGYDARDARKAITNDLKEKSLKNKPIEPGELAHGLIFFPGEATSARSLRLQIQEKESGRLHVLKFNL